MADALIKLLQARTVHISAGKSIGTGTLIAPGRVLTCAHVVRKAIDNNLPINISLPDLSQPGKYKWTETVTDSFLSDEWTEIKTKDEDEGGGEIELSTEYPDVAILTIARKEHALLRLPEFKAERDELRDKQFLAYGFQKKQKELLRNVPQGVSLDYDAEQGTGPLRKLMVKNGLVRHGMSGAALVDRASGELVGIMHMTRNPNDDLGAYVVPIDIIWHVFEKWEEANTCSIFSEIRSRSVQKKVKQQYLNEYPNFPLFRRYGWKLLILFILIILLLLYVSFHIGQPKNSVVFAILVTAFGLFGTLLGNWLGKDLQSETERLKGKVGKWFLKTSFLIGCAVIIALAWSFTTSVWIHGNSDFDEVSVKLLSGDNFSNEQEKDIDSTGSIRFFRPVFFYGDSIKLQPEGREPIDLVIKPFSRQVLYYPKDFRLEPVILLRFDPKKLLLTRLFYVTIEVQKKGAKEGEFKYQFTDSTLTGFGALVFGNRELTISDQIRETWRKELKNEAATESTLSKWFTTWEKMKRVDNINLDNNDVVRIKVRKKFDGSVVNEQGYTIKDDYIDKILKFEFENTQ